jgi:glutamate racemase
LLVERRSHQVIGVFDSGVGGLSVWREIVRSLPHEDTIYFADQAHCPYGSRSLEEIRALSRAIVQFLIDHRAKIIVVACNTASAAALYYLRERFEVSIVGMEPAVKPAAERTSTGKVGVMATPATFEGEPFARLMQRYASQVEVVQRVCPGLVELVEAGEISGSRVEMLLEECLGPLRDTGVDVLVLGCTHYPLLSGAIERVLGSKIQIIDPAPAVARQVHKVLKEQGLLSDRRRPGRHVLYTSGDVSSFTATMEMLLGTADGVRFAEWAGETLRDRRRRR